MGGSGAPPLPRITQCCSVAVLDAVLQCWTMALGRRRRRDKGTILVPPPLRVLAAVIFLCVCPLFTPAGVKSSRARSFLPLESAASGPAADFGDLAAVPDRWPQSDHPI